MPCWGGLFHLWCLPLLPWCRLLCVSLAVLVRPPGVRAVLPLLCAGLHFLVVSSIVAWSVRAAPLGQVWLPVHQFDPRLWLSLSALWPLLPSALEFASVGDPSSPGPSSSSFPSSGPFSCPGPFSDPASFGLPSWTVDAFSLPVLPTGRPFGLLPALAFPLGLGPLTVGPVAILVWVHPLVLLVPWGPGFQLLHLDRPVLLAGLLSAAVTVPPGSSGFRWSALIRVMPV